MPKNKYILVSVIYISMNRYNNIIKLSLDILNDSVFLLDKNCRVKFINNKGIKLCIIINLKEEIL